MNLLQQITAAPNQTQQLILDDGSKVGLTIYFRPLQYGWFITELTYGDLTYNGIRITTNPNILNQLRNVLPFGLGCYTTNNEDPMLIGDFQSGFAKLYLLSAAETAQYAEYLRGQT